MTVFRKVLVIGCPGAGKSTFARKLGAVTGLPVYHLDLVWHKADKTTVTKEEFDQRLEEILGREEWIIDGDYQRTLETRIKACDAVIFLDFPLEVCLAGVRSRVGQKREDMPWIEKEFDEEFRQWILKFPLERRPFICELLERYQKERQILIFKSREEADRYLKTFCYKIVTIMK